MSSYNSTPLDTEQYNRLVQKSSIAAIYTAITLIIIKGFVVIFSNSLSLYAALMDSVFDLVCSGVNIFILKQVARPADHNHSFGHGKFEYFGILGQAIFVGTSAIYLLINAIQRLENPVAVHLSYLSIVILILSVLITLVLVIVQYKIHQVTKSDLVKSDMQHYSIDLILNSSVLVVVIASFFELHYLDSVFAILIALYMLTTVWGMVKAAYNGLTDVVLPAEDIEIIESIIRKHPKVLGIHDLCTRKSSNTKYIQFHLELNDKLTLLQTHDICDELETALLTAFTDAMITIHPEPHSVVVQEKQGTYQPQVNPELISIIKNNQDS